MLNLTDTLNQLKNVQAQPAVSLFLPTHRTFPDNQQDVIALKNQLKQLEERLLADYDKRLVAQILEQIHHQTKDLNPNYHLDSLAIFATADSAQVLRLPFPTQERIVIDQQFSVRDFIRELSYAVQYYVVVISREIGRLIKASNDRVIHEFSVDDSDLNERLPHGAFPVQNDNLYSTSGAERATAANEDRLLKEFLNRVDKNVQTVRASEPLGLVIVGDRRNISFYESICDQPNAIIFSVDNVTQLEQGSAQHIIDSIQTELKSHQQQLHQQHAQQLDELYASDRVVTDVQQIYQAVLQNNVDTLYVQQGYMQTGWVDTDQQRIYLDQAHAPDSAQATDDVINHIIDAAQQHAANIVFIPADYLQSKAPLTLMSRYAV